MRARRIIGLLLCIAALGLVLWWAIPERPPQTVVLPDGSRLTLLKVTRGPKHACRYGNRWQDLLAPLLPRKVRAKFSPRILTFTSADTNAVMVWLRHEDKSPYARSIGSRPYFIAVADSNGLESSLHFGQNITASVATKNPGATRIDGWELIEYPHLAKQFTVKISMSSRDSGRLGFRVAGQSAKKVSIWTAAKLPATRQTNSLEVTLLKLETGLTAQGAGFWGTPETGDFSQAVFSLTENGVPTEAWSVHQLRLSTASGELRPTVLPDGRWWRFVHHVYFPGPLWLDEPVWKLEVALSRSTNFPAGELWTISGVAVPKTGELIERHDINHIHNLELEFTGVSGAKAKLPDGYTVSRPYPNVHFRMPYPVEDVRIKLIEIKDDRGRIAKLQSSTSTTSTGGRGITARELLCGFGFEIPEGTKTLDVTFAATKVRAVEFTAKPVMAKPANHAD